MAGDPAGGIRQCLTDLMRADTSGDYTKALQAANKLIRRNPKELFAYKCKIVSLLHLGQYADALAFIGKCTPAQLESCTFEHGYVLYRLLKNEEALEVLNAGSKDDYKINELKAQIYYKLEKFQKAYELFLWLLKNHSDEYDEERKANFLAVQAHLEYVGVVQQVDDDAGTFEQYYNLACQKIEAQQWSAALSNLDKAVDLCRSTLLEEGLTEEELEDELAFIKVQRAFVLHKMGRVAEAYEQYTKIQAVGSSDVSVKATLLNNLPGAAAEQNVAEARKKFKSALQLDQTKLTARQRQALMVNNVLALLLSNQREPCRRALEELSERFGSNKDTKLIHAALLVKMNEIPKAMELLEGDNDKDVVATRLHIAVNHGYFSQACSIISELPADLNGSPAVLSLLIASLTAQGEIDKAIAEIDKTLKSVKSATDRCELLNVAARLESRRGNFPNAAKYLEQLSQLQPDDATVKCQLIGVYSEFDTKKAHQLSEKVFPQTSNEGIDVDELEESDWILRGDKYKQRKEAKMETEDTEIITRKLKNVKRKRKIRLPKNYDPEVPPDPERWLPKQERAAYKKKFKKNRDRDIGRGTQGSASANPNVEYTPANPNSPRPTAPVAEGPRQMRPKQPKKKKKAGAKF